MFWSPGMMARVISPTTNPTMIMMMMFIRALLRGGEMVRP
ncbi:Uncharacterised protein [Bordetella pertussis]|nr:Uncharacterised protein [Bordetella pertussis]